MEPVGQSGPQLGRMCRHPRAAPHDAARHPRRGARAPGAQPQPRHPRAGAAHRRLGAPRLPADRVPARSGGRRPAQRRLRDLAAARRAQPAAGRASCCATPIPTWCCRRSSSSTGCAIRGPSSRCTPCSAIADPNVQQEAILAIGQLGDARSIPHLVPFLAADLWVQMAAVQALGDLRSPGGRAPPGRAADRSPGGLAGGRGPGADRRRGSPSAPSPLTGRPAASRSTTRPCSACSPTCSKGCPGPRRSAEPAGRVPRGPLGAARRPLAGGAHRRRPLPAGAGPEPLGRRRHRGAGRLPAGGRPSAPPPWRAGGT